MADGERRTPEPIEDLLAELVDGGAAAIDRALAHLAEPDRWAPLLFPSTPPRILASSPPGPNAGRVWNEVTTVGLSDRGRTIQPREVGLRIALGLYRAKVFRIEGENAGRLGGVLWARRVLLAAGGYEEILERVRGRVLDGWNVDIREAPGTPLGDREFVSRTLSNLKALSIEWREASPPPLQSKPKRSP
jgi:hypothetical protein